MKETISILGCGWYGMPLAKELISKQYVVKGATTTPEKLRQMEEDGISPYLVNFQEDGFSYDPEFFDSQILIICIPPQRNTGNQASFPGKIRSMINAAKSGKVENILFISSTSVYGDHNQAVTESSPADGNTPSATAIVEAEEILRHEASFNTSIIRFAGLIGPGRDPARFFSGKTNIPNGQAPVNLIHLVDCIGITMAIISQNAFGHLFNAVCPDHPSKQEFYTKASLKSGLEPPAFIDELSQWKKVSTNHIPALLKYEYKIADWRSWLSSDKL